MFLRSFFILFLLSKIWCAQHKLTTKEVIDTKNPLHNYKTTDFEYFDKDYQKICNSKKKDIKSCIVSLYSNKKFKKVISVTSNEIKKQEKKNLIDEAYTQSLYYYLALSKYQLQQYDDSISFFQSGLHLSNNNNIAGEIYFNLGKCYHKKGDYYQSIKHYKLAQSLFLKYNNLDHLFKAYVNITLPYNKLETKDSFQKSRAYFLKADSLSPYTAIGKKYTYVVKMGLGNSYNTHETLNIKKARLYYTEALSITKKNKDSFNTGVIYSCLGNLYNTTNPNLGIKYQTKRLPFLSKNDSLEYAIVYHNIASCYARKMVSEQSIINYKKSINYLIKRNINNKNWHQIVEKKIKQKNHLNKNYLLKSLRDLADSFLMKYKVFGDKKNLNESILTFRLSDQLLDLILIESQIFQSKLFWRKQSAELYGKAIEACFLANNYEKAFYFIEKNKALLLTKDLKNQLLKQSLNLPGNIVDKEIELKKIIYSLKHLNTSSKNKDSIDIALLSFQNDLKQLQDSIQANYIDYKNIPLQTDVVDLNELQNSLSENQAVLTYNISQYDDYGLISPENKYTPVIPNCIYGVKTFHPAYGLLITKDAIEFFKLENAQNLKNKVQKLLQMMRSPFKTEDSRLVYNTKAFEVYSSLLPSKTLQNSIKNKKLRIIPDNYLHYLPFEALKTSNATDANYWLQENDISYAYSNSFLKSIATQNNQNATTSVGFAPVNYDCLSLNPLQNSLKEINTISNHFSGTTYTHEKATKAQFLKTLPNYDIIHLATHADAQDSIAPWIAFKKEKLLLGELALTSNKAKMIVLSGCNTLLGKQEIGEGIMSLARGFFQSGAESVVSSLWNIDDRSTAEIMSDFYNNLKKGETKSKALQKAKINYLNNHSLSEASPYYWASFVMLGDTKPIATMFNNLYWFLLFLFVVGLISLYFLKKK